MAVRRVLRAPWWLLVLLKTSLLLGAPHWTELNIGPFYVDTDSDTAAARQTLTEMEQIRWVMSGLLDDQKLAPTWPVRVLYTRSAAPGSNLEAAPGLRGEYLLVLQPGSPTPRGRLAKLLLDDNTARLPDQVEAGLVELFDTLEAHGSRVTWGAHPAHPDLAFARMQMFATEFDYSASFHIFLSSLKNGSSLRAAESNAFGKPYEELEKQATARLAANQWQAAATSGRPLDPRRDLGEHAVPAALASIFLADAEALSDPKRAAADYRNAGGLPQAYEGLGEADKALAAGSHSAAVYLAAGKPKEAAALNPRWAAPLVRQAELASNPLEKEKLLKQAVTLDRRQPAIWMALAEAQMSAGHTGPAQGSWIQAETAAPTDAEREHIRDLHTQAEAKRLAGLEQARDSEQDATIRADRQAQRAQASKVRAAVDKANQSLDAEAKSGRPDAPLAWNQVVPEKKLEGSVTRVDCLGSDARLQVKTRAGSTMPLLWRNASELGLQCGDQKPPRRVSLTYGAQPDEESRTEGTVLSLRVWPSSP